MNMIKILLTFILLIQVSWAKDKSAFDKSLTNYEQLHTAFFANDLNEIHKKAANLLSSLNEINDEKINKTLSYSKRKLQNMTKMESLEEARSSFNIVSQGLLVILEKQSPRNNYSRYYCPMLKKYWIQNISQSEKVMNPYAPQSMPHCGEKK